MNCLPAPVYLGRSLEQWLADLLSADETKAMGLIGRALPCFGEAFLRRAAQAIDTVAEQQQAWLVALMARTGAESVPLLTQLLEHESSAVRASACQGVAEVFRNEDPDWPPAARQLVDGFFRGQRMSRDELTVFFERLDAAFSMAEAEGDASLAVITALIVRLDDSQKYVRIAAIEALGEGQYPKPWQRGVLTSLLYVLSDSDSEVARAAASVLLHRGLFDEAEVLEAFELAHLLQALDSADLAVRQSAAHLVRRLQEGGGVDVAAILEQRGARAFELGPLATCELLAMTPETIPQLLAQLHDQRAAVRACAAGAVARANRDLGWASGRRDDALRTLAALVDDKESSVRIAAVAALSLLKKPSSPDIDILLEQAKHHHDPAVRREATSALRSLAGESPDWDEDCPDDPFTSTSQPYAQDSVQLKLDEVQRLGKATLGTITAVLEDPDIAVRLAAIEALERLGQAGDDVSNYLLTSLDDSCRQVRAAAGRVVRKALVTRSAAWCR